MASSSIEHMIYKELTNDNEKRIVLTGEGGVGKTWMARKLTDLAIRNGKFDVSLWIYLNRKCDRKAVLESIARQLSLIFAPDEWEFEVEDEDQEVAEQEKDQPKEENTPLLEKIKYALEGKRLILVLDDEGNEMKESEIWPYLTDVLSLDQRSIRKILVTSRSPLDGKIITLEGLPKEESLSLLCNMLGKKAYELQGIQDLAEYFVENSRKLPLEISAIAKALRYAGENESGMLKLENVKEELMLHNGDVDIIKLLSDWYEPLQSTILADCCYFDNHFLSKRVFHYNELIIYWILEGYLHQFSCIADAFERGTSLLMELVDWGLIKDLEAGYVSMNRANFDIDAHDLCGFFKTHRLGLATVLDVDFGRSGQVDGVIKTVYTAKGKEKISTLLFDMDHLNRDIPDDFFRWREELKVLAIFNPTIERLESILEMHNLCVLVLRGCEYLQEISTVPEVPFHKPIFLKLQVLEISGLGSLTEIPDTLFTHMPMLQSLNLSSLQIDALPNSFYNLSELVYLILRGCSRLRKLESLKNFTKLELLDLSGATSFEQFHDRSFRSNSALRVLNLSNSKISYLPLIKDLNKLTHLSLSDCTELCRLRKIGSLTSLQVLDLSGSKNLMDFNDLSFSKLSRLQLVNVSQTSIDKLPSNISNPRYLYLSGCSQLKELPYIESMKDLQVLDLSGSSSLEEIEENFFCHLTSLRILNLSETNLKSLPSLSTLSDLHSLLVSHCPYLTKLGELESMKKPEVLDSKDESFEHLIRLEKLDLSGSKITRLPSLAHDSNLRHLLLKDCTNLEVLPSLGSLSKLKELNLSGVRSIGDVGADFLEHLTNLEILDLSDTHLKKLPSLSALKNLSYLSLRGCQLIDEVPGLPMLSKLEVLDLSGTAVKDIPALDNFCNLRKLLLRDCKGFQHFDDLGMLKILEASIGELPYNLSSLPHLEQLELPEVNVHEMEPKSTEYTFVNPNGGNWSISSWPGEALNDCGNKLGLTFRDVQFLQLVEKKPSLWESSFKQFHFLVCPTDAKTKFRDRFFYINELLIRDTYLCSQNRKREQSLEIRGFESFPTGLEPVLAHAEVVFLIDNPFVRNLFDLGANNIKNMKVCWIQRCCYMKNVLHVDNKDDATPPQENVKTGSAETGGVNEEIGKSLEILWVSDVVSMKSICDSSLPGFSCLKWLCLDYCSQLLHICFSTQQLKNLQVLQIKHCHNLLTLFEDESSTTLLKLEKLQLWSLRKLKNLGCAVPSLKTLAVGDCPLLVNVFSSTQLPENLEVLEIKFCDSIETVFSGSGSEMTKLHQLHLSDLPELKNIGARFPSLPDKNKTIRHCPKLL